MNVPKMERLQGLDASSVDPTTENVQFSATIKPIGVLGRPGPRLRGRRHQAGTSSAAVRIVVRGYSAERDLIRASPNAQVAIVQ